MLRLKEKPSEWIKFTAVMGLSLNIPLWLLWWKNVLPLSAGIAAACIGVLATIIALLRPRWFRGFYRLGMTVSFHAGQFSGKILLTLFFFLLLTPLGLLLRLMGKDLLSLKPRREVKTYWYPAKNNTGFDRMF